MITYPQVRLDQITTTIETGFACGKSNLIEQGLLHLRPFNIGRNGEVDLSQKYRVPNRAASSSRTFLRAGDILFNNTNSPDLVGKTAIVRENFEAGFSNHVTRICLNPTLCEPMFIVSCIRRLWLQGYFRDHCTQWVNQAAYGKAMLAGLQIPLPPLDEQRRIAGILNRAAGIERLRARAAECLDGFAPALFASMFGDPADNPMGWDVARLGEISTIAAGDPAPQEAEAFAENGPMFVRMQDVGRGHLNPSLSVSKDRLDPSWLSLNRLRLFPKNSILIPKSGVSVNLNHRAMLDTEAYVVSHLAVLIPDKTKVDPAYLFWWSVHYDPRKQVQVTSLPSLKLATLKAAPVPVPPLNMQRRFASIIRLTTRVFDSVKSASYTASTLTASLMDRLLDGNPAR